MRTIEIPTRFWKRSIAALGAVLGLALAPAPAQAEVCGDFDDIAEDLFETYVEEFGGFFGLSEKTCDSMTKTFYSACTTAVKDAVKCWQRQIGTIPKAAKPACEEAAKNPSSCYSSFKDEANTEANFIDDDAESAYNDCVFAAEDFFNACRGFVN